MQSPVGLCPIPFRRSRLVLSVARFLLVQARVRSDEKGAFGQTLGYFSAEDGSHWSQITTIISIPTGCESRICLRMWPRQLSSCDKNRDHLRGHDRNLESETLTRQSAVQILKKGTREIVRQKSNSLRGRG